MKIEITEQHKMDAIALMRGIRLGMINNKNVDMKLYGVVSTQLKLVAVDYIPTLATDGQSLFVNPLFVLGLKDSEMNQIVSTMKQSPFYSVESEEKFKIMFGKKSVKFLEFCCQHELNHCLFDHFTLVGTRDKQLYNQAADYRINPDLVIKLWGSIDNAISKEPIFKYLCLDKKYQDKKWTSLLIYDDLKKQQDQQQSQDGSGKQAEGQSGNSAGGSSQSGQPLDEHVYSDKGSTKETEFDKFVRDVLGLPEKSLGDMNNNEPSSTQMNNNRIKQAFIETAKEVGYTSGGIIDQIKESTKPVINWKRLLRKSLTGLVKSEQDPKRLHRRVHGLASAMKQQGLLDPKLGLYKAAQKPEPEVKVYCLFDTSGSISNKERSIMLSEVQGIMSQYKHYEIVVSCWDTKHFVDSEQTFTKFNKKEIDNYKFHGYGGTDIRCVMPYLESLDLKPEYKVIVFSDMYFGDCSLLKKYSKNLIFVSTTKNMEHATRNTGVYVEYDSYI